MGRPPRLIDPVSASEEARDTMVMEQETLSVESLSPEQVKPSQAKSSDPFDNYDFKSKMVPLLDKDGNPPKNRDGSLCLVNGKGPMVCVTHIVLHNHVADRVPQDPINRGKRVNYFSTSRRDEVERVGIALVFDRPFKTAKGIFYGCIVPQNNVRAQLIFRRNKDGQTEVDNRFLLLDTNQVGRLRTLFMQILNPKLKQEKQVSFIAGEINTDPGDTPGLEE
jgi:hypothetical protein